MKLKRIHLFEFEDFQWFPNSLRMCLTRYIIAIHKMLGSADQLAQLCATVIKRTGHSRIVDLCSGAGGPMEDVATLLKEKHDIKDLEVTLTDLYPNTQEAARINHLQDPSFTYDLTPQNAAHVDPALKGLRTMVCSMHHMRPQVAQSILRDAKEARQPICVFEISDNSMPPTPLWWLAIPTSLIMVFFFTLKVRPMTWQQVVFTYLIPVLPLFIAWDGAVSNARTYTLSDWEILLKDLRSDDYEWETGTLPGKPGNKMYLMGWPR